MGQDVCLIRSGSENHEIPQLTSCTGEAMKRQLANAFWSGRTFKRINVSDIKSLLVTIPPEAEQTPSPDTWTEGELLDTPIEVAQP